MKQNSLFIIFNSFFNRLLACLLFFCMIFSSVSIEGGNINSVILQSVNVSAETIISQFFYISTIPVNMIYGLFSEQQISDLTGRKAKENNKKKEESNSAKASSGYAVSPVNSQNIKIQLKEIKTGNGNGRNLINSAEKNFFALNRNMIFACPDRTSGTPNSLFLIMLLLAILISRRNIGDNNINIIKKIYKIQPGPVV